MRIVTAPTLAIWAVLVLLPASSSWQRLVADGEAHGSLEFVGATSGEHLDMVTSVTVSDDGRFLYASAWQAATVTVFARDAESGELKKLQVINDPENLHGATALRLSPDGRFAVAPAFRSQTAVLFGRDPQSGELKKLDVAKNGVEKVIGLDWAIDASFSPDSRFLYVIDSRGPSARFGVSAGSLTVFRVTAEDKLEFIESGQDSDFANARGIEITPDGKRLVVVSSDAASLVVLDRDIESGKTNTSQVLRDGEGDVHALEGAMGVTLSKDGRFAYVSAGRFKGDDAIGVYRFDNEGNLSVVEEFVNGESRLEGFRGGNEVTLSPDGRNLYAVASKSSSLACFRRDPETGFLTFVETIPDSEGRLKAAAGICLSPDGRYVYVAAEQSDQVSIYRRTIVE